MNTPIRPGFKFEEEMKQHGEKWITNQIDDACINYLENFGFYLCDKADEKAFSPGYNAMTTSQMRNVFGEIKRIQAQIDSGAVESDWSNAFTMLKPKLAYSTAKMLAQKRENRIKAFRTVLEMAHSYVKGSKDNFYRFSQFVEGIIAYHKVYGGRD